MIQAGGVLQSAVDIMECPAHIQHTITLMTLHGRGLVILHQNEGIHHDN